MVPLVLGKLTYSGYRGDCTAARHFRANATHASSTTSVLQPIQPEPVSNVRVELELALLGLELDPDRLHVER